jgi:outer membrane protein TolC
MRPALRPALAALLLGALPPRAIAQQRDSLALAALHAAALARDARAAERPLLDQASMLRTTTIGDAWKPQATVSAYAQHQSDVTRVALALPGASIPVPPLDRYAAQVEVSQLLYDGGVAGARRGIERAALAEQQAAVGAALQPVRDEVTRTFFGALLAQAREAQLALAAQDLEALLADTRARFRAGSALPRDTAQVRAQWRRTQAQLAEARGARQAARANLARLTGADTTAPLALPAWGGVVDAVRAAGAETPRGRPEFERWARARERLAEEAALTASDNRPRVVAFAQGGVGRPGLNQFKPDADTYYVAGVRVEWRPWTWGSAPRAREAAAVQQQLLAREEAALAAQLARAVEGDLADVDRLRRQLADDDEVIALREVAWRAGDAQRREGAITAAEATDLRTDLLEARLTRDQHRIELAQCEARILTTLGLVPRS